MGYIKWVEVGNRCWKGEIVGMYWRRSLKGSWGREIVKFCWVSDWVGSDIRFYYVVVKEVCVL